MMHYCKKEGGSSHMGTKGCELADPPGKDMKGTLPKSTNPDRKTTASAALVTEWTSSPHVQFGYTELKRDPKQQHTVLDGLGNILVATTPVLNPEGEEAHVAHPRNSVRKYRSTRGQAQSVRSRFGAQTGVEKGIPGSANVGCECGSG